MELWDGIFACEARFELVPWICVAMLIRIRNDRMCSAFLTIRKFNRVFALVIPADYSGQLTTLLRYPAATALSNSSLQHHSTLLLRQAFALYTTATPATGASLAMENFNFLGIPVDVPEPPPRPQRRGPSSGRGTMRRNSNIDVGSSGDRQGKERSQRQSVQFGLPEMWTRNLLERGESLGINKTVMNAVAELRVSSSFTGEEYSLVQANVYCRKTSLILLDN